MIRVGILATAVLAGCAGTGPTPHRVPAWAEVGPRPSFEYHTGYPKSLRHKQTGLELALVPVGTTAEIPSGSVQEWQGTTVRDSYVTIHVRKTFYVGIYVVSNAEWKAVMKRPAPSHANGPDAVATGMSRADVSQFLARTSLRLLTVDEGLILGEMGFRAPGVSGTGPDYHIIAEYRQEDREAGDALRRDAPDRERVNGLDLAPPRVGLRVARDPDPWAVTAAR